MGNPVDVLNFCHQANQGVTFISTSGRRPAVPMLHLHTFGGLALEDSGRPITGAGAQRSRLVLLAVLAASEERGISRDSLLALFWPENDTESARGALKQALYALRRDLGEAELTTGTTDLKLNRAVVDSDVGSFCAAFERGDFERAAGLYRGGFLEGVHLPSAEFDEWLTQQRAHLGELHREALRKLAGSAESRDDCTTALRWWKALAAADPLSAVAARSLMQVLVKLGDAPAALAHARLYEQVVRAELDSAPDPSVLELVQAIRRGSALPRSNGRGHRIANSEGEPEQSPPSAVSSDQETPAPSQPRPGPRLRLLWIGTGIALTGVIIGVVSVSGRSPALDPNSVVLTGLGNSSLKSSLDSLVLVNVAAGLVGRDSTLTVSLGQLTLASSAGSTVPRRHQTRAQFEVAVHTEMRGNSIQLAAEVTDGASDLAVLRVEPVRVRIEELDAGVKALQDRISISLESRRNPLFSSWAHLAAIPRTWESFEQLELGLKALTGRPGYDSLPPNFERAAVLDSTSGTPMVWLAFLRSHRESPGTVIDSTVFRLEQSNRRIGAWDRALLEIVKARNEGNKPRAHAAGHRLLELLRPNTEWNAVVAWGLIGLGRYHESLELLKRVPDLRWAKGWGPIVVARDLSHHLLGDFEGELRAARAELVREPDNRFYIQMEVKALGALGRIAEVAERCETSFSLHPSGVNKWQPCEQGITELESHGHLSGARPLAERMLQVLSRDTTRSAEEQGLDQAEIYEGLQDYSMVERALRPLPESHPEYPDYLGFLSRLQAHRGDRVALNQTKQKIQVYWKARSVNLPGPWAEAEWAALLGERDLAVDLLARHLREGGTPNTLHWWPAFAGLLDYPPFVALYKPVDDPEHLRQVLKR